MIKPSDLKKMCEERVNISKTLREAQGLDSNTQDIIEITYDLQAGNYIRRFKNPKKAQLIRDYSKAIAETIKDLCKNDSPASILEAGVGEATTLQIALEHLDMLDINVFGFDLSWSRVAYAQHWLNHHKISNVTLCTGNLLSIPLADNSIDIVYTSHSIEPNGGNEKPILEELFRVTRRFLILLEPGYELANQKAQQRMQKHGYCQNIEGNARDLDYNVLKHELFPVSLNPMNPSALTVIEKKTTSTRPTHFLACPKYRTPLKELGGMLYSPEALVVYPIVGGIPCLRIENGIFASKYEQFWSKDNIAEK